MFLQSYYKDKIQEDLFSDFRIPKAKLASSFVAGGNPPEVYSKPFAKKSGLPNVIAHGMLVMSFLGRMLTNAVPHSNIVNFSVQFSNMTYLDQALQCSGKVIERSCVDDKEVISIKLIVKDMVGQKKLIGQSSISIDI